MNRKLIRTIVFLAIVGIIGYFGVSYCVASPFLKEGDIVFQTSKSNQSKFIIAATKSPWSHCGIIIEKNGELYVLEAINKVSLTPYKKWKNRGVMHHVSNRRIFNKPVKIKYKKYLGIPYDLAFKFKNGKYYCSELVWEIYRDQFDTILAEPHPVSDYKITDKRARRLMKSRGISDKQLIVAPSDLR